MPGEANQDSNRKQRKDLIVVVESSDIADRTHEQLNQHVFEQHERQQRKFEGYQVSVYSAACGSQLLKVHCPRRFNKDVAALKCEERQKNKLIEIIRSALNEMSCEELPSGCDDLSVEIENNNLGNHEQMVRSDLNREFIGLKWIGDGRTLNSLWCWGFFFHFLLHKLSVDSLDSHVNAAAKRRRLHDTHKDAFQEEKIDDSGRREAVTVVNA